ncbi:flagellar hook-associated protein FlgK, partial [Paraburkholderia sp. SIMBA_030]
MPNELLDARNETVRQLSTFTGAQVIERDGNLDVYLGSGQPLVMGGTASTLQVVPSQADPSRMGIQLNRGSSTVDI